MHRFARLNAENANDAADDLVHGPLTTADRFQHLGTIAAKHKDATITARYVPKRVLR
ncbi:MAG: hypothetical protein WCD75_08080 [Rhodoplanes sp.]